MYCKRMKSFQSYSIIHLKMLRDMLSVLVFLFRGIFKAIIAI